MESEFVRKNEFSTQEYASLGRLLVALTELEAVLARSCIVLTGVSSDSPPSPDLEKRLIEYSTSSGLALLENFNVLLGEQGSDFGDTFQLDEMKNLMAWRNALCHGRYHRSKGGDIRVEFFSRNSVKHLTSPEENTFSTLDIDALSNEVNRQAYFLQERFLRK